MAKPNEKKTREELIAEISELRRRLAKDRPPADSSQPRSERKPLLTSIELIPDFDVLEAQGINLSKSGIAFAIDQPLWFEMRFKHQGVLRHHRARLVWLKDEGGSHSRLGLELIDFDPPEEW